MALPMDEQRVLEEIERRLAGEDPKLAARLTAFGHPGLAIRLRSRRGRMLASLIALVTLAVISVAAYLVIPLGGRHAPRPRPVPMASQTVFSARSPGSQTSRSAAAQNTAGQRAVTQNRATQNTGGAAANPSASRSAANPTR